MTSASEAEATRSVVESLRSLGVRFQVVSFLPAAVIWSAQRIPMMPSPKRRVMCVSLFESDLCEFDGDLVNFCDLLGCGFGIYVQNHCVAQSVEEFSHFFDVRATTDLRI